MENDWLFIDNNEILNNKKENFNKESYEIDNINLRPYIINNDILQTWRKKFNLIPTEDANNTEEDCKIDILDNKDINKEEKKIDMYNKINKNLSLIYQNYKKKKFLWNSVIVTSVILYCKLSSLNYI